jgi:glyoxylase I family protein
LRVTGRGPILAGSLESARPRVNAAKEEVEMDTIEAQRPTRSTVAHLPSLPLRLHHHAYVVKDHEANRRFLEDLLGIPLVATWCEKSHNGESGEEIEFCHTFFGLADGSALAFFQFADPKMYEKTQAKMPAEIGRYDHIALKVDDSTYDALKARLDAAGEKFRETDHGYCKSIYTNSPDGLIVEFTCDPPDVEEIDAIRRADAHSELQRWLGGDRHVNNELRHRG